MKKVRICCICDGCERHFHSYGCVSNKMKRILDKWGGYLNLYYCDQCEKEEKRLREEDELK